MVDLCVCVPARNEANRLPILFGALAAQTWPGVIPISLAINNTTDDSLLVIDLEKRRHARRLDIRVVQAEFPPAQAHAGSARKLAMDAGLAIAPADPGAILVSTDADARPPIEWLARIVAAFDRGADLIGGRIEVDPNEPLPASVWRLRTAWDRYWETVRAIEDNIDPLPWDPAPRHGDHTGASLAMRAGLYRACGGVPPLPTGEDRALVTAALKTGARLAHPADVWTFVSPRRDGRAQGGMADAMHQMFESAETGSPPLAPALDHWRGRAAWRKRLRGRPDGDALIARREPLLPPMPHDMVLELSA
ncbi:MULTISPECIES: glycosyltransferase [Sphingomonas]|uniref:Glycosyltransferase 2-like domain-containing protein n=1 Tax=Sphingomonas bisphenolicum TaxID=296544 RepID=A0ABN5WF38_9SPHN|nr:glycosyltransferase [Sphingomonas bisphenolicum]BBF70913.1 hypothetical protein SBA_ch1_31130 [Sphingomonas bisphenolicum]